MSCLLTCEELNGMDIESIIKSLIVIDDNGCMALRSTAEGGGGSYTFPSNSGNTAYVSSGGNNATAVIGNISKPYLTIQAAIVALGNTEATIVVLSYTGDITITNYNSATMPFTLHINILCPNDLYFTGSASFTGIRVNTSSNVYINTGSSFAVSESILMNCKRLTIPNTAVGTINYLGTINCDDLVIATNANITIEADVLMWTRSVSVGTTLGFTYNICPPLRWKAKISQIDTDAPTVDVIFENDYGETFTTDRGVAGDYEILSAGNKFDSSKTRVVFGQNNLDAVGQYSSMMKGVIATGSIKIYSFDAFLTLSDNMIAELDIEIETYL